MHIPHAHLQCTICQSALTVHEQAVGKVCGRTACQREGLKRRLAVKAARQREIEERSRECRRQVAQARGEPQVEALPLAILPSNPLPVVNLPEKRRRRFRDHLMQVVSEAAARRCSSEHADAPAPPDEVQDSEDGDDGQLALWAACCALCRGDCCRQGDDHAFLDLETILRYMDRHPEQRPLQVLEAYLSHVGQKTYEGACVYQGRRGCTLPRAMRAEISRTFFCPGLAAFRGQVERDGAQRGFAVAWQDGEIVRAGFVDAEKVCEVDSSGRGATLDTGQTTN